MTMCRAHLVATDRHVDLSDYLECIRHYLSHYAHVQVTYTLANKLVLCESFFYPENRMFFLRCNSDVFIFKAFHEALQSTMASDRL